MIAEAGAGIVTTVRFSGRGQEPEMISEPISRFWFTEESDMMTTPLPIRGNFEFPAELERFHTRSTAYHSTAA